MATLTLHQGDQHAEYVEHPTEVARKALMAAAEVEEGLLGLSMRQAAQSLPKRERLLKPALVPQGGE